MSIISRLQNFLLILLLSLLFTSSHVQAAGLFLLGRGVHPLGRAGASIAGGDTLQTMWYNPANLVELTGFSVLLDVGVIQNTTKFSRAKRIGENGKTLNYEPVQNEQPALQPDPSIMLAYGWEKQRITIALGLYAPYASPVKFSDTGSQRYSVVDVNGSLFAITQLSIAWAPHPRFRIGAGVQNQSAIVRLVKAASGYLGVFGGPEDKNLDLYTEARIQALFNISGNIGVWGRILDFQQVKLDIAASAQMPVYLQGTGEISVRLPTHPLFDPTSVEGKKIKTSFFLPLIVRAAARITLFNRANLEFAFVYEGWSILDELRLEQVDPIVVRNVPTIGNYKIPRIVIPRNLNDAFSIRVGGSVKILPKWLRIRAGYAYETNSVPDTYNSVFFYDSNKHMFSVGLTLTFSKMAIDISYAHILLPTRTITASRDKQLNPLNEKGAIIVGNGTYSVNYNIIGIAWRGSF